MGVIDITPAGIAAHQAERKAFLATEIGGLLNVFRQAYGNALLVDERGTASDRRLREIWEKSETAEEALVAAIKRNTSDECKEALRRYHDAVETLLTLPEGGMRDLVITKLADAHIAATKLMADTPSVLGDTGA